MRKKRRLKKLSAISTKLLFALALSKSPYSFYIGLTRIRNDSNGSEFEWVDKTPVTDGFSNWANGEPNNVGKSENCVNIGWRHRAGELGYQWVDVKCTNWPSRYICQKSAGKYFKWMRRVF